MQTLSLHNLTKSFDDKVIINRVDLSFTEYGIHLVRGENGSGKTTLLKIIAGLIITDDGSVENNYNKEDMSYCGSFEMSLFPYLTGKENIDYFSSFFKVTDEEIQRKLIDWAELDIFREILSKKYQNYSAGMKQVLKIFISLLNSPGLLVMDEPFNNLDKSKFSFVKQKLQKHSEESIIILSNHINLTEKINFKSELELINGNIKKTNTFTDKK